MSSFLLFVKKCDCMKTKKQLLLYVIIILFASVTVFLLLSQQLSSSRPIVVNPNINSIVRITYNPNLNQDIDSSVEIVEYDETKILSCLNRYKEQKTLSEASGYWLGGVEIEILVQTENGLKSILLGNINYSYESVGEPKYKILNADSLRLELLQILNIAPYN